MAAGLVTRNICTHPGVQRRQRRVLDTSSTYVRGEENLHGWRPRGDSLIFDHQWELEKLTRLEEVGRVRHLLQLRERLGMDAIGGGGGSSASAATAANPTTKSEKDVCNLAARAGVAAVSVVPLSPQTPVQELADAVAAVAVTTPTNGGVDRELAEREYTAAESELLMKCVHLIQGRIGRSAAAGAADTAATATNAAAAAAGTSPNTLAVGDGAAGSPGYDEGCADMNVSYMSGNSMELCSPDRCDMPNGWEAPAPAVQTTALQPLRLYVPELEEIRVSPVVARKGYLNVLEHGGSGWKKRWVVRNAIWPVADWVD